MKKLRLDQLSILFLALIVGGAILVWGDYLGIRTAEDRGFWLSVVAVGALVLAIVVSFDHYARWAAASRQLSKWLQWRGPEFVGTTQGSILAQGSDKKSDVSALESLREALRRESGWRWRYRQPWLLLTGDDAAIRKLLPELHENGWLTTADMVLLWARGGQDGQVDAVWLKQLYKLRRRRAIDAVIVVSDGEAALPAQRRGTDSYSIRLARIAEVLRWSAPIYVLEAAGAYVSADSECPIIACEFRSQQDATAIEGHLLSLRNQLAQRGVPQLFHGNRNYYLARLSQRLDDRSKALAEWAASLAARHRGTAFLRGIAFAPYPSFATREPSNSGAAELPLWSHLGNASRRHPGKRVGWHPATAFSILALAVVGLWITGMLASAWMNGQHIQSAQRAVAELHAASNEASRLRGLVALQQQIEHYEYRTQHHAPLLTRFGLNRDAEVLAALWKPYAQASRQLLVTPVQQDLEASLADLTQLQTSTLDDKTSLWALGGRDGLKAYLMLAQPARVESGFLAEQLAKNWTTNARITPGEKQDLAERLFRFYAQHLKANPAWRIDPDAALLAGARRTLLAVIGERNAQDTVYQGILNGVGNKYPDLTLASLTSGTDTRGLLRTTAVVPGVFTRQAYEGYVADAIDAAAKRRDVAADWVLSGEKPVGVQAETSADALRAALTAQYFDDYAARWQDFMNSLQWEPVPTMPAAIDQLKLLADARQSPVIALMKSVEYQGRAGLQKSSLSDTLVNKARDILGKKDDVPDLAKAKSDPSGPLGATFGPVLRLLGQGGESAGGDLSLQRFMDRATALRLRLQQVSNSADADAQARQMAQALLQGKGSELADTQTYAQLIAASLGAQWGGMGEALFVRPIAQAMQTVLQPAQASLNDAWRQGIVMPWGRAFAGRYPFASSSNDASLAELSRYLRPQVGLIDAFISAQLAGVLELQGDQWVPVATAAQALTIDPGFLKAINMLRRVGTHMLAQGEAQYRFELKPVPTPGLTDTVLMLDGQKLHYYNQRETWQAMTWPTGNGQDAGTRLQWQTESAGTNKNYEFGSRLGWLRMLERAQVVPIDSATFDLTWQAVPDTPDSRPGIAETSTDKQDAPRPADIESLTPRNARLSAPAEMQHRIHYLMRTELGQGPLEMLFLRDFAMPTQVFEGRGPVRASPSSISR